MNHWVLVVEDDADLRQTICDTLSHDGIPCAAAADGEQALARMDQGDLPAVILLDLMMPTMNGWQFRERQLRDPRLSAVPVVVMTASRHHDLGELGDVEVLRKPIGIDELLRALHSHLPPSR